MTRQSYAPEIRIIRLMCTGRVDLAFVLRAFEQGADGVIIGGCWPGECHYVTEGNYDALGNMHLGKKLLARLGLDDKRLRLEWIAASEGMKFAEVMSDFASQLRTLGPLGAENEGLERAALRRKLGAATQLVPYIKLVVRDHLRVPQRTEEAINAFYASAATDRVFDELIADRLPLGELLTLLGEGPQTAEQLAAALGLDVAAVLRQTSSAAGAEAIEYDRQRGLLRLPASAQSLVPLHAAGCQRGCPIGTEAWRYVAHIRRGEYEQAYLAIREPNPFPSVCARVCDHKCEQHCRLGQTGEDPVAIRALKRFVTDTIDPSVYAPPRAAPKAERVAVVGAGPAGLSAAHLLSLRGYRVTVFDAADEPGGMLRLAIPAYRLPREVLDREIAALVDDNVTLRLGVKLGTPLDGAARAQGEQITIDGLLADGFAAVFLALGAQHSIPLRIDGEAAEGVHPSLTFLGAHNLRDASLARGKVGVIGGGNSAIDAARVALRQPGVEQVTILYRRTREEMPAFAEEIDAALDEGAVLRTLLTPVSVKCADGKLSALECVENKLGPPDASGRRRPVPIAGSEQLVPLDTLIVAVSERPAVDGFAEQAAIKTTRWQSIEVDPQTLATSRAGVFAGGDVVTGPNTVVDAIAAGKRAAVMIERYLAGEALARPAEPSRPSPYVERGARVAGGGNGAGEERIRRAAVPHLPVSERRASFAEAELGLSEACAKREAGRCLRCDLDLVDRSAGYLQNR